MKTKSIEEIVKGDKIVLETRKHYVEVHTVKEILINEGKVISEESEPLDLLVDFDEIIVLDK